MQHRLRTVLATAQIRFARIALLVTTILTLTFAQATFAQNSREQVEGVQNFGRVTEHFFRGGKVTPDGVGRLAEMGVRTIVDLRDEESPGEAEACQQKGIKYFKFPMSGHDTPNDKAVNEILSIIQRAKEPVYVHCSAGKHRSGTIAALYRVRVQGWSREQAWAEQQFYGFGSPEGHPQLYAYVYGKQFASANADIARLADRSAAVYDEEKSSKKTKAKKDDDGDSSKEKKKKDDDGDSSKAKKKMKSDGDDSSKAKKKKKSAESLKKDYDSEGEGATGKDRNKTAPREASTARANIAAEPAPEAEKAEPVNSNLAGLSATASYISLADAIKRAKDEGGKGDALKIDLEWDAARSVVTWDVTFSSGYEYEVDAASGKFLGTKSKAPAKLATLSPLALDGSAKRFFTFQEIIRKAEASRGQTVMEIELKQIKGRSETVYEVVLGDGATIFYDAATGATISGI